METKRNEQLIISPDIIETMTSGAIFDLSKPEFSAIGQFVKRTLSLNPLLNASTNNAEVIKVLEDITGNTIGASTTIFTPFHTNFGRFLKIGSNVFINHACSCLDMGGITIEDNVLIGPKVNLLTENHPLDPANRRSMFCKPILIKRNAWIGAAATILPGVTIGENAVVAAGAVVSKDVADNTVVGGVPAKLLKTIG
jgi:acetyltransferase-like isoleucine patch superfamily enzyme